MAGSHFSTLFHFPCFGAKQSTEMASCLNSFQVDTPLSIRMKWMEKEREKEDTSLNASSPLPQLACLRREGGLGLPSQRLGKRRGAFKHASSWFLPFLSYPTAAGVGKRKHV